MSRPPKEISFEEYNTFVRKASEQFFNEEIKKVQGFVDGGLAQWLLLGRVISLIFSHHFGVAIAEVTKKMNSMESEEQ